MPLEDAIVEQVWMDDGLAFSIFSGGLKNRSERNVCRRNGALSEKECITGNIQTLFRAEDEGLGRDRVFRSLRGWPMCNE